MVALGFKVHTSQLAYRVRHIRSARIEQQLISDRGLLILQYLLRTYGEWVVFFSYWTEIQLTI